MHPITHAQTRPDHPAMIMAGSGETVTFGEMDAYANRFAQLLRARGLERGDHFAVLMENNVHYLQVVWGSQRAGTMMVPISTRLTAPEIAYILKDAGAKFLLTSTHYAEAIAGIRNECPDLPLLIVGGEGDEDYEAALAALGVKLAGVQVKAEGPDWFHPGRRGQLIQGRTVLASFGEIHPAVAEAYGLKGRVVGFEIHTDDVPMPKSKGPAKPLLSLSVYQPVTRDFAFIVDCDVAAGDLLKAVKSGAGPLLSDMRIFDLYEGATIGEGKKSVAVTELTPTKFVAVTIPVTTTPLPEIVTPFPTLIEFPLFPM